MTSRFLERISSFIFNPSEPDTPHVNMKIDIKEEGDGLPETDYMKILASIKFDGRDFKAVYKALYRYFELKPASEFFSPFEQQLIKEIVDSVAIKDPNERVFKNKLKTTSILKKKRQSTIKSIITNGSNSIKELVGSKIKQQVSEKETPLVHEEERQEAKVEQPTYVVTSTGRRAKVFSARFDDDYELDEPSEPIQIEVSFSNKTKLVDSRLNPEFKTIPNTRIPKKEEMLLRGEAEQLLLQVEKEEKEKEKDIYGKKEDAKLTFIEAPVNTEPFKFAFDKEDKKEGICRLESSKESKLLSTQKPIDFTLSSKQPSFTFNIPSKESQNDEKPEEPFKFKLPQENSIGLKEDKFSNIIGKPLLKPELELNKSLPETETKPFLFLKTNVNNSIQESVDTLEPKKSISSGDPLKSFTIGKSEKDAKNLFNFNNESKSQPAIPTAFSHETKPELNNVFSQSTNIFTLKNIEKDVNSNRETKQTAPFEFGDSQTADIKPFTLQEANSMPPTSNSQEISVKSVSGAQDDKIVKPTSQENPTYKPFSFGSIQNNKTNTNESSSIKPFTFGASQETKESSETKPIFSFGSQVGNSKPPKDTLNQFSFGNQESKNPFQSTIESQESESETLKSKPSLFTFGSIQSNVNPSFGSQLNTTNIQSQGQEKREFSFGSQQKETPATPFVFGSQSTTMGSQIQPTQYTFVSSQNTQPAFTFGSQPAISASNQFTPGNSNTNQPNQFSFGSPNPHYIGNQISGSEKSQFSFGASASQQSSQFNQKPNLDLSDGNSPSSPFSTTNTSTIQGRKIAQPILKKNRK